MTQKSLALSHRASAQDLAIFSEFFGTRYSKVKSLYSSPSFVEELKRIRINIQGGQGVSLGARPTEALSIFFDDGESLRRYQGAR
ncbi:hypothetical protein BDW_10720 [Bdellovibrio bacteriovorus W]|nr:hypothetical protein BDW_10720 [Bdellovibrio bacteriovorus W]